MSKNTDKIEKTPYFSKRKGLLAKGCELCVRGEKSVLFITGVCPRNCFYCPISDKKKNQDVKYINERKFETDDELIEEIKLSGSKGVGITGGDPLTRMERTVSAIKLLKGKFGKDFHIHLYTSPDLVTKDALKELHDAGLDEIRFHADLDNEKLWERIKLAKDPQFKWDVGIEIPSVPGKEELSRKLVEVFRDIVDFFNFNELEISDLNAEEFQKGGFELKDDVSYAVKGSEEIGLRLLSLSNRGHFCTCKLKDRIQLGNRIIKRAHTIKKSYDSVTDEGMLIRGAIYINALPNMSYEKLLAKLDKDKEKKLLFDLMERLISDFGVPINMIDFDSKKYRLLTSEYWIRQLANQIDSVCAIVTEYPTYDNMDVEIDYLN